MRDLLFTWRNFLFSIHISDSLNRTISQNIYHCGDPKVILCRKLLISMFLGYLIYSAYSSFNFISMGMVMSYRKHHMDVMWHLTWQLNNNNWKDVRFPSIGPCCCCISQWFFANDMYHTHHKVHKDKNQSLGTLTSQNKTQSCIKGKLCIAYYDNFYQDKMKKSTALWWD